MTRKDLNWVFDQCLVKLQAGASLESVLSEYPEWKQELRPVLETVLAVWESRGSDTVPVAAMTRSRERLHEEFQRRRAVAPRLNPWQRWLVSLRMATVPAVVLLVTLGLALTGLASVQALPGEPLYPVKLAAERFTLSLPASASQKLAREETFDSRRSEEVEALVHQAREQEVFFTGYLTQGEDQVWRVGQITVVVPAELVDSLNGKIGRYVYVHADLMPNGQTVVEWVEDRLYSISGRIQALDGQRLRIDGIWVDLSPEASAQGKADVGSDVTVSVVRLENGQLLAVELKVGGGQPMEINAMPTEQPGGEMEEGQLKGTFSLESTRAGQQDGGDNASAAGQQSTPEPQDHANPTDTHEESGAKTPEPTRREGDRRERSPEPSKSPKPTEKHDD